MAKAIEKVVSLVGELRAAIDSLGDTPLQKELRHESEVLLKSLFRHCRHSSVKKLEQVQKSKVLAHAKQVKTPKTAKGVPSLADPKVRGL